MPTPRIEGRTLCSWYEGIGNPYPPWENGGRSSINERIYIRIPKLRPYNSKNNRGQLLSHCLYIEEKPNTDPAARVVGWTESKQACCREHKQKQTIKKKYTTKCPPPLFQYRVPQRMDVEIFIHLFHPLQTTQSPKSHPTPPRHPCSGPSSEAGPVYLAQKLCQVSNKGRAQWVQTMHFFHFSIFAVAAAPPSTYGGRADTLLKRAHEILCIAEEGALYISLSLSHTNYTNNK